MTDPPADRDPLAEARQPERIDLDAVQAEAVNDLELDEGWMHAIASLVAELRAAREKLAAIQRLLQASPIGPTRAQAVSTLFEIRLIATTEYDQATGAVP